MYVHLYLVLHDVMMCMCVIARCRSTTIDTIIFKEEKEVAVKGQLLCTFLMGSFMRLIEQYYFTILSKTIVFMFPFRDFKSDNKLWS